MMAKITDEQLRREWEANKKSWDTLYRWERCKSKAYSESIAGWVATEFADIELRIEGLRNRSFRRPHFGQSNNEYDDREVAEKMLCRAMFNQRYIPGLGSAIDYETPLKETDDAGHGDVDLLCLRDKEVLCVEAKKLTNGEFALKAIMEAFVYARLVKTRLNLLKRDFEILKDARIRPVFLTFAQANSFRHLTTIAADSSIWGMISRMNKVLESEGILPIEMRCGRIEGTYQDSPWERLPFDGVSNLVLFKRGVGIVTDLVQTTMP